MLGRTLARRVSPLFYQFLKTKTSNATNQTINCSVSRASVSYSTNVYTPRWYSQKQANTEEMPTVDYEYVKKVTTSKDVLIIDVREPDEVKEHGKIPNSVNIPLGTVATTLSASEKEFTQTFNRDKPNENTEIIFYCMIGKRSGKAQQNAVNLGYKNTKNYLGSWTDWVTKSQ